MKNCGQQERKSQRLREQGFSLVEALLVTVLMLFVFTAFGTFLLKLSQSAAQFNERAKQNEDTSLMTQSLTKDFERLGANLSLSEKDTFTGQIFVPFENNADYQINGNQIVPAAGGTGSSSTLVSSIWWQGRGVLTWSGNNFSITLVDGANNRQISADNTSVYVYENQQPRAVVPRNSPDSQFSIVVTPVVIENAEVCHTQYVMDGQSIFTNSGDCALANNQQILASTSGYINQLQLNAAAIVYQNADALPVRLPLLPVYGEQRLTLPFVQTESGFVLFRGDDTQNVMYLSRDQVLTSDDSQIVGVNDSSGLGGGDVLLLSDYLNLHSALFEVSSVSANSLTVKPIYQPNATTNAAFSSLFTPLNDFSGRTFSRGTRIVKLAAPIEYQFLTESGETALYRREIGSPWEMVIPHLNNYSVTSNQSASRVGFDITFDVLSEGIESGQLVAQNVRLSISPSSLNRLYDTR